MPKKFDKVVFCPLTSQQVSAYVAVLASDQIQEILTAHDPCPCDRQDPTGYGKKGNEPFPI